MKTPRWLTLAALTLVGTASSPALAQWVPGGTLIATRVFDSSTVAAVPDGKSGALVFAPTFGGTGEVKRVGPDGVFPPGWPSTVPQAFVNLSSGLAADGAGGAYVGRVLQGPTFSQIVVRHLLSDGSLDPGWPPGGRVVADLPGSPQGIQLASDGAGGVYAVFVSNSPGAGLMGVLRLDITGAVSPGWPDAGVTIASGTDNANYGDVQATAAGVYVTGFFSSTFPATDSHDAFIGHVSPTGAVPAGWGTGSVPVPFLPAGYGPPPYTVDAAGGIYFTWRTSGFVGRLAHLLPDASPDPAWPVRGLALLADTTHYQILYKPVSDGAGGCFVRFVYDSAGTNVVVPTLVHMTANATTEPGWPALGGRLPYDFTNNAFPDGDIVPDGLGGAYVTWFEERVPEPFNAQFLRAHHIASGGVTAPYWPASGLTLAGGPGGRIATKTVTDSHGGAIAIWSGASTNTTAIDSLDVLALGFGPDGTLTTSVGDRRAAFPVGLHASPVPARGPTSLVFALAKTSSVRLDVLDLSGRRIRHLLDGTFAPGPHSLTWDGLDDAGHAVPPGVYLAHANGDGVVSSARLVRIQ